MTTAHPPLIPLDILMLAYRSGIFPMADSREDKEIYWVEPRERAIIPLDTFHPSTSLAKVIRQDRFHVTCNADFAAVISACAAPRAGHPDSWISGRIKASYRALHKQGHAHSIECWQNGELVGGLYGVSFDQAFCGESMFSRVPNASKVALTWLVALLRHAGFRLLDCQFMTDHLRSMGAIAMSQDAYLERLAMATMGPARMTLPDAYVSLVGASAAASADGLAAGAAVGDCAGAGARRCADSPGFAPAASGSPAAFPSSPGKVILQSFTHTS